MRNDSHDQVLMFSTKKEKRIASHASVAQMADHRLNMVK
jgi:hypothetical protein